MKILLIEDEKKLAYALSEFLTSHKNIIDIAYNGQDGLDYAFISQYDVIVLDVMLPKKDGYEVSKCLRQKGNNTPILMLTAKDTVPDKVTGLNAGADDYMTKPFSTEELLARLNALTRRKGIIVLNELVYQDILLNLDTRSLMKDEHEIYLSHKEFEIMKLLMNNPNISFSKDKIIEKIWGNNADITENSIEAYISFLRKKLNFLSSTVQIKTISKLGYRLKTKENDYDN